MAVAVSMRRVVAVSVMARRCGGGGRDSMYIMIKIFYDLCIDIYI